MARFSTKRTLEEIANKSDSEDFDYSDHAERPSKSSHKSKKQSKPAKKRRRRDSDDDDDVSDDDLLSEADELSYEESEEDGNIEKNARGLSRRKAVKNRPVYKEDSEDEEPSADEEEEEDDDDEEDTKPPPKARRNVITLKFGKAAKKQATLDENQRTRRSTRHNRDPSEDIYALTNSGRHVETIEEGIIAAAHGPRTRRASKTVAGAAPIEEEDENGSSNVKSIDESAETKASQLEVLESDPQNDYDDDDDIPSHGKDAVENADVEMADDGVIPESDNEAPKAEGEDDEDEDEGPVTRRRNRPSQQSPANEPDSQAEDGARGRRSRKQPPRSSQRKQDDSSDFEPGEEESEDDDLVQPGSNASPRKEQTAQDDNSSNGRRPGLRARKSQSRGGDSEVYVDEAEELAEELQDLQPSRRRRRNVETITYEDKPRRSRKDVDYRLIRPDLILPIEEEEGELAVNESPSRRGRGATGAWQRTLFSTSGPFGGGGPAAILGPPGAPGATANADSDSSDDEVMQIKGGPTASGALAPGLGGIGLPPAQTHNADAAAPGLSGTPANFGKVKDKQALADADPLGIDPNVNFDSVGGLQGHIDQLKEMVALPLLYPEIFQRFHIVPPRGVLFHGPPGTGKTLMARALASSVSSEGQKVTFYMRKGADALSKWVGEAERQLRLLFEEARKTQPSIIFFDEIDGMCFFMLYILLQFLLTDHRTCTRKIKQARADSCFDCLYFVGFDGWYGW